MNSYQLIAHQQYYTVITAIQHTWLLGAFKNVK